MLGIVDLGAISRFELRLLRNWVFSALKSWKDWLTIVFCLCVFGVFALGWFTQATAEHLNLAVFIVSALLISNAVQTVVVRVHYHQSDGPITHNSLSVLPNMLIFSGFALAIIGILIAFVAFQNGLLFALVFGSVTGIALAATLYLAKAIGGVFKVSGVFYSLSAVGPGNSIISLRLLFGLSCVLSFIYIITKSIEQVGAASFVVPGIAVVVLVFLASAPGPTLKFRAEMGHGPGKILFDAVRPIAVFSAAPLLTAILVEGVELAVSVLALVCLVLAFTIVRALLFQVYAATSARRAFSLFLTGMLLLGVLAPILIIFALPGAIFALYKKAHQSVWSIS